MFSASSASRTRQRQSESARRFAIEGRLPVRMFDHHENQINVLRHLPGDRPGRLDVPADAAPCGSASPSSSADAERDRAARRPSSTFSMPRPIIQGQPSVDRVSRRKKVGRTTAFARPRYRTRHRGGARRSAGRARCDDLRLDRYPAFGRLERLAERARPKARPARFPLRAKPLRTDGLRRRHFRRHADRRTAAEARAEFFYERLVLRLIDVLKKVADAIRPSQIARRWRRSRPSAMVGPATAAAGGRSRRPNTCDRTAAPIVGRWWRTRHRVCARRDPRRPP